MVDISGGYWRRKCRWIMEICLVLSLRARDFTSLPTSNAISLQQGALRLTRVTGEWSLFSLFLDKYRSHASLVFFLHFSSYQAPLTLITNFTTLQISFQEHWRRLPTA